MLQLARYAARAPIALERLHYDRGTKRVRLVSDKREGPTAGTRDFDPLEFLALLVAHVPDHHEILVRYSGAYSVRRRARWRTLGILTDTRLRADPPPPEHDAVPEWPALRALRSRWAQLLRRIFEVDPLRCPRCGHDMRILAFIFDAKPSPPSSGTCGVTAAIPTPCTRTCSLPLVARRPDSANHLRSKLPTSLPRSRSIDPGALTRCALRVRGTSVTPST